MVIRNEKYCMDNYHWHFPLMYLCVCKTQCSFLSLNRTSTFSCCRTNVLLVRSTQILSIPSSPLLPRGAMTRLLAELVQDYVKYSLTLISGEATHVMAATNLAFKQIKIDFMDVISTQYICIRVHL